MYIEFVGLSIIVLVVFILGLLSGWKLCKRNIQNVVETLQCGGLYSGRYRP